MPRFSSIAARTFGIVLLAALVWASQSAHAPSLHAQGETPFVFTLLGPDGAVARAIISEANCPEITIDGATSAMQVRAAPDADFPVTVCDAAIPTTATSASLLGHELKLPQANPDRVVAIGDTGCRLKGDFVQACNDPAAWPFERNAAAAAATNPDLVIHVGDYHYRESPCVVDKANCTGSPYGDNWAAWNADFFTPARSLLEAAPWVFVVGNHEDCARAGIGYFRMLDPRPMPATCEPFTAPYAINYMDPQLVVFDNSAVNDFEIVPEQLAEYQKQFAEVNQEAKGNTWFLLHDPMYVFGHAGEKDGKEQLFIDQLTLQQASNNNFPPSVKLFIGGHIHLFQVLSFGQTRPPQLVVGNGGTFLDAPVQTPLTGLEIAGMKVGYGTMMDKFGFTLLERAGDKWTLAVKGVDGANMDSCVLADGSLLCGQAALPVGGIEVTYQALASVALIGGAVVLFGGALGIRGRQKRRRNNGTYL